jgi:3-oxoacyl-[acyl-carrier protein] reductase
VWEAAFEMSSHQGVKKRALVTGGSGALGAAICRALSESGLHVIVHSHAHPERAEAVAREIRDTGGSAETTSFDVCNFQESSRLLEALVDSGGAIQVVVNNAGVHSDAPLAGMSEAQWDQVVDVSLKGFFNVTRPLLLPMIVTRWGRIISVSSVSGLIGNRGQVNYSAAKAGLHGATKALAREVATRGITVNAVAPGIIDTPDTASVVPDSLVKSVVPMNRRGTPVEVASLVAYLASDAAGYLSGQVISVNGAMA